MARRIHLSLIRIFEDQHGIVGRDQVLAAGGSDRVIAAHLAAGTWAALHPGTYGLAGSPDSWLRRLSAACLWAGPGAAVSHNSAAALWELPGFEAGPVEVSTPRRPRPGGRVKTHRTTELSGLQVNYRHGLPVTAPHRTLIDLGRVAKTSAVETALDAALCRSLTSVPFLWRQLNRLGGRGRPGAAALRSMLVERMGLSRHAESVSETRLARVLIQAGLSGGHKQFELRHDGEFLARVDYAWPDLKLAIEVDSWRFHSSKAARRRDATRQNGMEMLGWTVLRFFWEDIFHDPELVLSQVRATRDVLGRAA